MTKDLVEGQETSQSSVNVGCAVKNGEQKKASGCMKVSSLMMEGTKIRTRQQRELMHNEEGTDAHTKLLDKELMASTKRICPAKRNADVLLTDNTGTQEVKNSHLTGAPTPPLDCPAQQDGSNIQLFHKLEESITELTIEDSKETFTEKIDALRYLAENGFSVEELLYWLVQLINIKCEYTKNLEGKRELNVERLEDYKALARMQMELVQLRWKGKRIAKEIERTEAELSSLEDAGRRIKKALDDHERKFASIRAEVRQKLGLIGVGRSL